MLLSIKRAVRQEIRMPWARLSTKYGFRQLVLLMILDQPQIQHSLLPVLPPSLPYHRHRQCPGTAPLKPKNVSFEDGCWRRVLLRGYILCYYNLQLFPFCRTQVMKSYCISFVGFAERKIRFPLKLPPTFYVAK